jgi:hypothetical protein
MRLKLRKSQAPRKSQVGGGYFFYPSEAEIEEAKTLIKNDPDLKYLPEQYKKEGDILNLVLEAYFGPLSIKYLPKFLSKPYKHLRAEMNSPFFKSIRKDIEDLHDQQLFNKEKWNFLHNYNPVNERLINKNKKSSAPYLSQLRSPSKKNFISS